MRTWMAMVVWLAMAGCSLAPDTELGEPGEPGADAGAEPERPAVPESPPAPPGCLDEATWRRVRHIRNVAEQSVHELVTCGRAQMSTVNSMVAIVLFSNPEFFKPETVEELKQFLEYGGLVGSSPFTHTPEGLHTMPINGRSTFAVRFFRPEATLDAAPITETIFDLESYLQGAQVETALSWEAMKADLTLRNTYTLTWAAPGPLADVLFPTGVPADGRVQLQLSIWDFAYLFGIHDEAPDFGPFEHLADLVMDSQVDMADVQQGVEVRYAFGGERGVLADLRSAGRLGFQLQGLRADDGGMALVGEAADLRYLELGTLAGRLLYELEGADADLHVVDDFGAGASYPVPSFYCPDAWPPEEHADLL